MGSLTRLAKDTAIYGVSSILARAINFLFVPLYTRMLFTGEYGVYSEIFAYIALLQVALTFGLETGFFRFANRNDYNAKHVFSTTLQFLFITSTVFFAGAWLASGSIAHAMGYYKISIIYTAGILAIDCFTSILFAKLRYERKAVKFVTFRSIKILSEVAFNLIFLFFMPTYFANHPESFLLKFIPAIPDHRYILAAVFCSCLISLLLFIPEILRTKLIFSKQLLKPMLSYSLPLMIAGLPGIANDSIDRLLFRFFAPDTSPWLNQLGIFNANAKIAVIILLFTQMFRYAAEPFFFSSSNQPNIKQVYADVMKYFAAFCMIIFVFITLYLDVFTLILGKDFRSGIIVIPILLLSYVLLGINQNLSMWYKLSDKTNIAVIVTISGLLATLLVNIIFMPFFGYYAAAFGHLVCYTVMIVISYRISLKYYPIPYQWGRVGLYIITGVALYALSTILHETHLMIRLIVNTIFLALYILFILKIEHINVLSILKRIRSKFAKN